MSKNLSINTTPKDINKRYSSKSYALQDENTSPQRKQLPGFIEENDEEEEDEEEEEEEEEEEGSDFSSSPSIPDENMPYEQELIMMTKIRPKLLPYIECMFSNFQIASNNSSVSSRSSSI
ncbi:hypothetical protein RMCBS344292_16855 [Rhizopus microsporus]|nr:hypothetical protein RMCBS344292_16855 [Rhizopus microsporus]